jgi:hypothetical protein
MRTSSLGQCKLQFAESVEFFCDRRARTNPTAKSFLQVAVNRFRDPLELT